MRQILKQYISHSIKNLRFDLIRRAVTRTFQARQWVANLGTLIDKIQITGKKSYGQTRYALPVFKFLLIYYLFLMCSIEISFDITIITKSVYQ